MTKSETKQKHVYRKLGTLKPYENNARTHDQEQLEKLVASIQKVGFITPIVIDEKNTILAGHGRHAAAGMAGLEEVPCVVVSGLDDNEKAAFVISDNKIALLADWDIDLLATELSALDDAGYDIESTGFDYDELADIERELAGYEEEKPERAPAEVPENTFTLIFDNSRQELKFCSFMKWIDRNQAGETAGEKLQAFLSTLEMDDQ